MNWFIAFSVISVENLKILKYIIDKTLVLSIICDTCGTIKLIWKSNMYHIEWIYNYLKEKIWLKKTQLNNLDWKIEP